MNRARIQTLEWRKFAGPIAVRKLEDLFGTTEAFKVMFAQVMERCLVRQIIGNQIVGRVREQDLPAMPQRQDAGDPVEGRAEVVAVTFFGHSSVERHAHPQRAGRAPRLGVQRGLHGQHGLERIAGADEDRVNAITNRLEDDPAVGSDPDCQDTVMTRKRSGHRLRVLLPELRAAFDIRETEGERASRECRCGIR